MMTTERPARSAVTRAGHFSGARLLVRTAVVTAALAVAGAVVAVPFEGRAAAAGALVGAALVVAVLAGGGLALDAVAGLMPTASLLVALLTFTLQVVVLLLTLVALERSGLLGATLDRQWLGGAVIVTTMTWLAVQVRQHTTARVPVYDLPDDGPHPADEGGH